MTTEVFTVIAVIFGIIIQFASGVVAIMLVKDAIARHEKRMEAVEGKLNVHERKLIKLGTKFDLSEDPE